ncbi:MAG: hypothetical protein AAF841_01280 [Pseudomonadota bacterium]
MDPARRITFYLDPALLAQAKRGKFNFINRVAAAVAPLGYHVAYGAEAERRRSAFEPGFAIYHRVGPDHDRALTMRQVYHPPFWTIEASKERWEWAVSEAVFDPSEIDPDLAARFVDRWRRKLFSDWANAQSAEPKGHFYVPLQGRLLHHRSFQSCTPIEMLESTLHWAGGRAVIAALHPREFYAPSEMERLAELTAQNPNLALHEGQMHRFLPGAIATITQNSAAAFNGYFFGVPAVLFAEIDFHHIAVDAHKLGALDAFRALPSHHPDYDRYLYWFWQIRAINAGHESAERKIRDALARGGWHL